MSIKNMGDIEDEIRSMFEAYHYTDEEMIEALEALRKWCWQSINNIQKYM